jgi:hypothetical protein
MEQRTHGSSSVQDHALLHSSLTYLRILYNKCPQKHLTFLRIFIVAISGNCVLGQNLRSLSDAYLAEETLELPEVILNRGESYVI